MKAAILARIGDMTDSIAIYADVLRDYPAQPKIWMSYGHALKTNGREQESISAYKEEHRTATEFGRSLLEPGESQNRSIQGRGDRRHAPAIDEAESVGGRSIAPAFRAGQALEDARAFAESFEHYAQGNQLRRAQIAYRPDDMSNHVRRIKTLFTSQLFEARKEYGAAAPDPIFIVGLPRAGSTLIEQILSSHSQVEGTMELPDITAIAKSLVADDKKSRSAGYSAVLASLDSDQCRQLVNGISHKRAFKERRRLSSSIKCRTTSRIST